MDTKQTEALRLAASIAIGLLSADDVELAGHELRHLHAKNETLRAGYDAARLEIESLNAQLEAVGAGGVGKMLMRPQPAWQINHVADLVADTWTMRKYDLAEIEQRLRALPAAPQPAAQAAECGKCFEGKSDMDHDCRKCGGTGVVQSAAQALDARRHQFVRDNPDRFELADKSTGTYPETWQSYSGEQIDDAIDAAIAAQQGGS